MGAAVHFSMHVATGTTLSSSLDLGAAYNQVTLGVPTMTSGANIYVHAAGSDRGTYRKIFHKPTAVSAGVINVVLNSSVTQCFVPLDFGARYLKLELTTKMSDSSHAFDVICQN